MKKNHATFNFIIPLTSVDLTVIVLLINLIQMKNLFLLALLILSMASFAQQKDVINLEASQSMGISGQGPGRDGAINPYQDGDSVAIVENQSEHPFSVRTRDINDRVTTIEIPAMKTVEINLPYGTRMYFDTEKPTKTAVSFKDN